MELKAKKNMPNIFTYVVRRSNVGRIILFNHQKFDEISTLEEFNLTQIEGIVIIDEIDLNLHIEYAKMLSRNFYGYSPKFNSL
ncbi:hypothetical protein CHE40_14725 [Salmonella enterica]|nr:hypothetical protein CHE40_14725 [Salmonella enterica]